MARQIMWAKSAQEDKCMIFSYWNERNKSVVYSRKLNQQINSTLHLLRDFPQIGRPTQKLNVRSKAIHDYLILYKII